MSDPEITMQRLAGVFDREPTEEELEEMALDAFHRNPFDLGEIEMNTLAWKFLRVIREDHPELNNARLLKELSKVIEKHLDIEAYQNSALPLEMKLIDTSFLMLERVGR